MRRKIFAGRAQLRRGVQIVMAVTLGFAVFLVMFSRDYIAPYDTAAGQVALAVVVGIFAAAFAWMRKLSVQRPVAAFLARPGRVPDPPPAGAAGPWSSAGPAGPGGDLSDRRRRGRRPARGGAVRVAAAAVPAADGAAGAAGPVRRPARHRPRRRRHPDRPRRRGRAGWGGCGPGRAVAGAAAARRRGIAYTGLRQDLALSGGTFETGPGPQGHLAGAGLAAGGARVGVCWASPRTSRSRPVLPVVLGRGVRRGVLLPARPGRHGGRPPRGGRSSAARWAPTSTWSRWRWPDPPRRPRRCRRPRGSAPAGR